MLEIEVRTEVQWQKLFRHLESREPLARSKAFIERSDRIFAAIQKRKN